MTRIREISDERLLAACAEAIGRYGTAFTIAQVAAAAQVSVGTVAGRFGSKHGLLLALMADGADGVRPRLLAAAAGLNGVEAVRAAVLATTEGLDDPSTAPQHLGQLGADLADPDLRAGLATLRTQVRDALAQVLTEVALPGAPAPDCAAGVLAAVAHGTVMDWALAPDRPLAEVLGTATDAVLEPWSRTS